MFAALPLRIQEQANEAYQAFLSNPHDPSLQNHPLADTNRSRHRKSSRSVWVTRRYRAIYVVDGDVNVWYWIGSHEDYNNFVGK